MKHLGSLISIFNYEVGGNAFLNGKVSISETGDFYYCKLKGNIPLVRLYEYSQLGKFQKGLLNLSDAIYELGVG